MKRALLLAAAAGYVIGTQHPVRRLAMTLDRTVDRALSGELRWVKRLPEALHPAAGMGLYAAWAATHPLEAATLNWQRAHPDPSRRLAPAPRLLTAEERAQRAVEREQARLRPPYVEHWTLHRPWWEARQAWRVHVPADEWRGPVHVHLTSWGARRAADADLSERLRSARAAEAV